MPNEGIAHIADPDPRILRLQYAGKQRAGEIRKTGCVHPASAIEAMVDDTPHRGRNQRPTNMFYCSICHTPGRLVMYDGVEATDG